MKKAIVLLMISMFFGSMAYSQTGTMILISTDYGDIKCKLYDKTPGHRDNFIKLVKEGWFNGSTFHRVIEQFMIQGGGKNDGATDVNYTIPAEIYPDYFHKKGALSAARQGDHVNPQKKSSGSQFYIVQGKRYTDSELSALEARKGCEWTPAQKEVYRNVGGTPFLDFDYTVFGEVVEGLDVVDKIAAVQTDQRDKPLKDIKMTVTIVE